MANKFLHSIVLTNGSVQGVVFDYLVEADLPHTFQQSVGFGSNGAPNDASLLASGQFTTAISLEQTFTDMTNPHEVAGQVVQVLFNPSGTVNASGIGLDVRGRSTGTQAFPYLETMYVEMDHYGTGTAASLGAVDFVVRNVGNGNVTALYSVAISAYNDGTGTVGTMNSLKLYAQGSAGGTTTNVPILEILSYARNGSATTALDGLLVHNQNDGVVIGNNIRSLGTTSKNLFEGSVQAGSLLIKSGANAKIGTGTLSGGTTTISTTAVTASSLIFLGDQGGGVLANIGSLSVGTVTPGTSFVVNSSNALDSSKFAWLIIEPA